MFLLVLSACLLAQLEGTSANAIRKEVIISDRQLVLAFVVNRHGDRAPDEDEMSLSNIKEKMKNLTYLEGPEGLTLAGKRRAYLLGKFYRQRYGSEGFGLISNLYLPEDISVRCTDKDRTKMTASVAMAAVYPPVEEQQWDEGLGKVWQPVPYSSRPLSEDYLRYYSNCCRFKTLMSKAKEDALATDFVPYRDLIVKLKQETGRNFTEDPLLFEALFDLFKSQVGLGLDIPEWAKPHLPRLSEAARLAYRLYFRNDEMKKLGGGVILNDFIEAASSIATGSPVTKRFRVYSAHDFNIGALMDVTRVIKEQSIPEYGSVFALELYQSKSTGELSVMPVYLPQAGESAPLSLRFTGCERDEYCEFNKFKLLTKDFVLPEHEFYNLCGIKAEL